MLHWPAGLTVYDRTQAWREGIGWKGDGYAVHVDTNANVRFVNENLFACAGIALPTKDWGWRAYPAS